MDKDKSPTYIASHDNIKDEVQGIISVKSDDNIKIDQGAKLSPDS